MPPVRTLLMAASVSAVCSGVAVAAEPGTVAWLMQQPSTVAMPMIKSDDVSAPSLVDLTTWASNSVVQAYTFAFDDWQKRYSLNQANFTPDGWKGFRGALESSGVMQTVLEKKYVMTAAPMRGPILIGQGRTADGLDYKLRMYLMVTYLGSDSTQSQKSATPKKLWAPLTVDIIVVRRTDAGHLGGLGIAQLIAQ